MPDSNADVHEIQSFVNVALATAAGGEGDLSHDRLSHLRTIGSGFASLIYNFPEDADFFKLKEACKSVWDALEKNENLPKLLVSTLYHYYVIVINWEWRIYGSKRTNPESATQERFFLHSHNSLTTS